MKIERFFKGIQMMPEAVKEVEKLPISEEEYQKKRELFQRDKYSFYKLIRREKDFRIRFLYFFSRMACETYLNYKKRKISDKIYWDTFYALTLWCENSYREYKEYGIDQYDWFFRHIECKIFRLGRLEFEKRK